MATHISFSEKVKEMLKKDPRGERFKKALFRLFGADSEGLTLLTRWKQKEISDRYKKFDAIYTEMFPGRRRIRIDSKTEKSRKRPTDFLVRIEVYNVPKEGEELYNIRKYLQKDVEEYAQLLLELDEFKKRDPSMAKYFSLRKMRELKERCEETYRAEPNEEELRKHIPEGILAKCKEVETIFEIFERIEAIEGEYHPDTERPEIVMAAQRVYRDKKLRKNAEMYLELKKRAQKYKRNNEYMKEEVYPLHKLKEVVKECSEGKLRKDDLEDKDRGTLLEIFAEDCEKAERALEIREKLKIFDAYPSIKEMAKRIRSEQRREDREKRGGEGKIR